MRTSVNWTTTAVRDLNRIAAQAEETKEVFDWFTGQGDPDQMTDAIDTLRDEIDELARLVELYRGSHQSMQPEREVWS